MKPNIIFLVIDSVRSSHLGAYGYQRPVTPFLDKLAAQSLLFEQAITQAPFTVGSTASFFTGLYPSAHHMLSYGDRLPQDLPTMASVLQQGGYETAAFVANPHVNEYAGYTRHFDVFREGRPWWRRRFRLARRLSRHRWGEDAYWLVRAMEDYLTQRPRQKPFFLFGFFIDPHTPYTQSAAQYRTLLENGRFDSIQPYHRQADFIKHAMTPADVETIIDLYDAEIRWVDKQLELFVARLDQLGYFDNTLLIITADHGEGIDLRPWRGGHGQLYENGVHVPLLMTWPRRWVTSRRLPHLVGLFDLLPTVAELVDISPDSLQVHGQSLWPIIEKPDAPWREVIYSETAHRRMVRTATWKYLNNRQGADLGREHAPKPGRIPPEPEELYRLDADREEEQNLVAEEPVKLAELRQQLESFAAYIKQSPSDSATSRTDWDAEFIARLRGLGYLE